MWTRMSSGLVLGLLILAGGVRAQADVAAVERELLAEAARNVEKYRKGDVELVFRTSDGKPLAGAEIRVEQVRHEFLFGCIIFDLTGDMVYNETLFKQRFSELFNFAVFPFYWDYYEPRQGRTEWKRLQPALEWCRANGITAKGHPLVWSAPAGYPAWLDKYSTQRVEQLLEARVKDIIESYRGQIGIFDVVNEPVNCRIWGNHAEQAWFGEPLEQVAPYVEKAFKWAYSANPEAELILNEFHVIDLEPTRERFYQLVRMLQQKQTPLSGLGIQSHEPRDMWYPPVQVWQTFDRLAELGYPLHITEFIPQSGGKVITGGWRTGVWNDSTQAEFAEQYYRLSFGHPAVKTINWWGLSDRDIWQPGGGLIDAEYNPKPVYKRLQKLLNEEWRTAMDVKTDRQGRVALRAFYGDYKLILRTADGRTRSWDMRVTSGEANHREFTIK